MKNKEKCLKEVKFKKKNLTYRKAKIRITPDFSSGTMQARREANEIFKVLRKLNNQKKMQYYPSRLRKNKDLLRNNN